VMQPIQNFVEQNFFVVWCFGAASCLLVFGVMAWRQFAHGPKFPSLSSVNVLHRERFASGCSHRSLITRLGGAQNMLHVVLTDSELWVTTFACFRGLAGFYDLDHRIPLTDITSVDEKGKSVILRFNRSDRSAGRIQLWLRDKTGFIEKLMPLIHCREPAA
jgi:hypothetical protein